MAVKPPIAVCIPRNWCLSQWTQIDALRAVHNALTERFPDEEIHMPAVSADAGTPIEIAPLHSLGRDDGPLYDYEDAPQERLRAIGALVVDILIQYERQSLEQFRVRLERSEAGLRAFAARPRVLSEFMVEIADLYGFVIETDMAMLMAADHFGQIAAKSPQANQQFIRNREVRFGTWGLPYQYSRTAKQLDENYSVSGKNRILRNRSVILFLYELWERKYRSKLASCLGGNLDIQSDLFGDLRIYRNCISHNGGVLDTEAKMLRFVERGGKIDLPLEMDGLFELVVAEINRLALVYFNVTTKFSFENVAPGIVVAGGKSWRSDRAIQPPSPPSKAD